MALGRAFIEVHADLKPFKKQLGAGIATLIKQTQQATDKAVRDGLNQASNKSSKNPVIRPELDTSGVESGGQRISDTMKRSVEEGAREGFDAAFDPPGKMDGSGKRVSEKMKTSVEEGTRKGFDSGVGNPGSDQKIVGKMKTSVEEGSREGFSSGVGKGDKDSRVTDKMKNSVEEGTKKGFASVWDSPGKTFDRVTLLLIGAIAAAVPFIAPMIAGALAGAVALAGIGTAIALSFADVRIKSAAQDLWDFFSDGIIDAASSFVGPMLGAISTLKLAAYGFIENMTRGFRALAPYVDDLATGLAGFVDKLGSGLADAFANAGPFIEVFAEMLPVIGDSLGYMMSELMASEGARAGFLMFLQLAADLIIILTDILTWFSDRFRQVIALLNLMPDAIFPDQVQSDIEDMVRAMEKVPEPTAAATNGMLRIRDASGSASNAAKDLTASLNMFFGAALGWTDAAIRFEASIDGVADSFKQNSKNIDINTEKGRTNVTAVQNSIKAAIAARDAKLKETGSVLQANETYTTHIERLRGVLKAAGLTKGQIDKLIGAYDEIPPEVSTEVKVPGLATALSQAQALSRELNSINSQRIKTRQAGGGGSGVGGYAEGGVVTQQQLAWVGEGNKPEAIIPLTNPGRAAEVMAEAGLLGMGGGEIRVQLILDGKVIDERVVRADAANARRIRRQPKALI